ncbi:MAG: lysylphosphatidylglycerol synthase transmembrane domain-containing protein [Peptostreptococcaceae bacterium]
MISINNKRKNIIQGVFLIALICMTTYMVVNSLDFNMLSQVISILDYKYIGLGFSLMIIYILLEGHVINLIINSIHGSFSKSLGFKLGIMGLYYNLITPMASGSQPIQIYELTKANVSTSKASAIVVNKTIVFQVVVTIYCGVMILFNLNNLQTSLKPIFIFVLLGMFMNITMLGFGFFIVFNPTLTKRLAHFILNKLCGFKFLRFLENKNNQLDVFIDEYNCSVRLFAKDKKALAKSLIFTFLQLTIYFSVAFCISRALNLSGTSFVYLLSLQVFLYMAVSSMPTPGNVGANEVAFFTLFAGVIPKGLLGYSVFLYGVFVYYFLLIVCGLFTILNQSNIKDKLEYYIVKLYKPSINI